MSREPRILRRGPLLSPPTFPYRAHRAHRAHRGGKVTYWGCGGVGFMRSAILTCWVCPLVEGGGGGTG